MRENMGLYRGKRKDNGEWVKGAYYKQTLYYGDPCGKHYIITSRETLDYDQAFEYYEVDPKTVGECVNIPDENGKMIFEGDIVKNEYEKGKYQYFKVFYCNRLYCWQIANKYGMLAKLYNLMGKVEVIGNIHDNPELLY